MNTATRTTYLTSQSTRVLRRCVYWLHNTFIKAYSSDEDTARKEFILNVILAGSILFLSFLEFFILYKYFVVEKQTAISPHLFSAIYLGTIALLALSRKGYIRIASHVLIGIYVCGCIYGIVMWGPDLYQVVLTYALVVILTGILINSRSAFIVATIFAVAIVASIYLNIIGVITFHLDWRFEALEINDGVELSLTLFMITLISWLSNREIKKSLQRARASEKALTAERDLLEEKVEERTAELRQLQAQKVSELYRFAEFGRLSSGIFHDLINPLSAVALNVRELKGDSYTKLQEYVDRAVSASKRMESFIEIARKQLRSDEARELFSVEQEIRDILKLLNYKTLKVGATITVRPLCGIHTYGNPLRFQQIITNLVSNALDAIDSPHLESDRKEILIDISTRKSPDEDGHSIAEIIVEDRGCGIPQHLVAKIFDPFFTTKSSHKGMGLGLSTTKQVVEKEFNGTITIKSTEHVGSQFIIHIPIITPHP